MEKNRVMCIYTHNDEALQVLKCHFNQRPLIRSVTFPFVFGSIPRPKQTDARILGLMLLHIKPKYR